MRLVTSVLALVLLVPATAVFAEDSSGSKTVPLLVRTADLEMLSEPGSSQDEWVRIEVPLQGTAEETRQSVEADLGRQVALDRTYPLLGPEEEPAFTQQWSLENTGQSGGTPDADIDATDAWPIAIGSGVVVAVVDSGIQTSHPELADRIWQNPNETLNGHDDDGNGVTDDIVGWDFVSGDNDPRPVGTGADDAHGTAVAGVIAATVNGTGITGVAPGAQIMNLRACDDGSCSSFDSTIAIYYAVDAGADIINLSFGGPVPEDEGDPPLEAAISYARQQGVLVVSAAGNEPPQDVPPGEMIVPAEFPADNNVSVAASTHDDQLAPFAYYSPKIDIAAPGVSILTTGLSGLTTVSGSSFAAPFVAGTAALVMSAYPTMGYSAVVERLTATTDKPSHIAARIPAGRLNAGRALTQRFLDTGGHLFEHDIDWLAARGTTKGCNPPKNTRFCPDEDVTRQQMAAFLARHLDLPPSGRDFFVDDDGSIFEGDINRLAAAGITRGCSSERFCPASPVTRAQMAAFLVRSFGLKDRGAGDLFDDDNGSIFEGDIDRLGTAGITRGCNPPSNDRFCPDGMVTRGAMAAFLHRADDLSPA